MRASVAICVAVAAASLALPSQPSFDPWAWIVWGRELLLLDLDTTGGPSWKPLPVVITALAAPLSLVDSDLPAAVWLVVGRTGTLLSLVLAFRLARRLAGPGAVGVGAGAVAALALALAPQWLRYAAHGNEVPMAVALLLWGVERHLDGRRGGALVAAFLACLLRPEAFPFLAVYAAWLWRADPALRRLTVGLAVALPALWLVPDWLASGDPLGAGRKASSEPPWSLSTRERPWLAVLGRADRVAGGALEAGTLAAAVLAALRRDRTVLALCGIAVGWIALVVAMTELGFSGSTRYFVPAVVIASVVSGVAAAWTVAAAAALGTRLARRAGGGHLRTAGFAAGALAVVALAVAAAPWVDGRLAQLDRQLRLSGELSRLQAELPRAIARAGGEDRVLAVGLPVANRAFQTRLAWELRLPLSQVEQGGRADGLVFVLPASPLRGQLPPAAAAAATGPTLARVGLWRVRRRGPARYAAARRGAVDKAEARVAAVRDRLGLLRVGGAARLRQPRR